MATCFVEIMRWTRGEREADTSSKYLVGMIYEPPDYDITLSSRQENEAILYRLLFIQQDLISIIKVRYTE